MKDDTRAARHAAIAEAAYRLLAERGYGGTSMLAIAKAARASNETLYRWYGDKPGLFRCLIADNAAEATALLQGALASGRPPLEVLAELGPILLSMLTGERAVALNRAAAADPTGVLGRALAEAGRAAVGPLIAEVIAQAAETGEIGSAGPDALSLYLDLLVGDLQIRRAIGALPPPDTAFCAARADVALKRFLALMRP